MHINLIGPGRLGKALIASLLQTGKHKLLAVYHPDISHAEEAINLFGQGTPINDLNLLPKADITCITCPDDKIPALVKKLTEVTVIRPGSIIMHASGILNSTILEPLKQQGASIASVHPLKAFRKTNTPNTTAFQNILCAIEGDDAAITILTPLWESMGAQIFSLNSEKKSTYHAAAVMASNYLVTLASEASNLFKKSGVSQKNAHDICLQLMQTSLDNLKHTDSPEQALTGPLSRGDIHTIQQHLDAISSEQTKTLYCAAGLATLPLTDLKRVKQKALEKVLCNRDSRR